MDIDSKVLAETIQSVIRKLTQRIAKLEDALKSIATQPKSNEWEQEGDTEHGYDTIIDRAREALKDDK